MTQRSPPGEPPETQQRPIGNPGEGNEDPGAAPEIPAHLERPGVSTLQPMDDRWGVKPVGEASDTGIRRLSSGK